MSEVAIKNLIRLMDENDISLEIMGLLFKNTFHYTKRQINMIFHTYNKALPKVPYQEIQKWAKWLDVEFKEMLEPINDEDYYKYSNIRSHQNKKW